MDRKNGTVTKIREFINELRERIDDFTFDQIYMIEKGLASDLPLELIRFYARPDFDTIQMEGICNSYENGFSLEQLQRCITSQLNRNQWEEIILWAKHDLDFERFVEELGGDLLSKTSYHLTNVIKKDLIFGLSWEKVREIIQICKEKDCLSDDRKIVVINDGILAGLTKEEIEACVKSEHDYKQVEQIIEELIWKKENEVYKNKKIASFLKSLEQSGKFNEEQLKEIKLGFVSGLTIDQVKLYADEKLSSWHMMMIRLHLQTGYPKEQIRLFADLLVSKIKKCPKQIDCAKEVSLWLRDGLPLRFFDYLIQCSTDPSWVNWWRKKLKRLLKDRIDENQLNTYCKKIQSFIKVCKEVNLHNKGIMKIFSELPGDQIETYSKKIQALVESYRKAGFDNSQITEIILGHLNGLSEEQIRFYARHEFSGLQMEQIRLAYLDGLTQEEIEFLDNPKFNYDEMKIIRLSFKYGLSSEQVKKFIRLEYDRFFMQEFFLGYLWNLSEEAIEFYRNTKLKIGNYDEAPSLYGDLVYFYPQTILRIALLKGLTIPEIEFALQKFLPQKRSLKLTLEEFTEDKKARAKLRSFIELSTKLKELKEDWTKGKKKL